MVKFHHSLLQKMKEHAGQAYPDECCGVLLGKDGEHGRVVLDVVALQNERRDNRERRYLVSPEEYRRAEVQAKEKELEVVGLYHSHPDHPAEPSRFDLEHAMPWWSYIIVSVEARIPAAVRSWILRDDRQSYEEEEITIFDGEL